MDLKAILEALLFASGKALSVSEMAEILEEVSPEEKLPRQIIESALHGLQADWEERGGGMALVRVAEGYEFRTSPEFAPWLRLLNRPRPQRLTLPAVETLALIAYRQPITRTDIESIRGVDTAAVLRSLLERKLIRVVGRKEEPGRPLLYATTKDFLEFFGLKDLSDLPPLKELEEMIRNQAEATTDTAGDLSVSDLITTPEELVTIEESDREALEELDERLQELKKLERSVEATNGQTEPVPSPAKEG